MPDAQGLLEGLFHQSPVAQALFGADGRCLLTNPAYCVLFGAEPPAGYNLLQDEAAQQRGLGALLLRAAQGEQLVTPSFWSTSSLSRRLALSCTFSPLRGAQGEVGCVVVTYKDLTAEWTARETREQVLRAGRLGHWTLDLRTLELTASEGCRLNFGLPPDGDLSSYEKLRACIHPEDRPSMEQAVERAIAQRDDYFAEYRILTPQGATRWVVARGRAVYSEAGEPREMVGITVDITDLRQTQHEHTQLTKALAGERARLQALADTSTALAQASTDFGAAARALARLAGGTLGECCVLTLVDEARKELNIEATYHADPEAQRMLDASLDKSYSNEAGLAMEVVRTGRPVLHAQVPQEGLLEKLAPAARPFTQRYGVHSLLIVPLRAQGRVIGTLGLSRGMTGMPYTLEDRDFLQELADRAGLVIQNVRLLKAAQEAVRLRDDFLSIASHELKTPLTPLSLKLQSLKLQSLARRMGPEQGGEAGLRLARDLDSMMRQVKRLSDLISDLLDVARISGGRLRLRLEPVELAELVREVVARFQPEAERAGCTLQVHVEEPLVGNWDRLRLEQVVTNLLSNAVKYGAGKPIHVSVEVGAQARLTVRDEGIGIGAAHLERIFDKFERAVSERHYGGLGLGLYITQQIVRALGGSILVESELERGSVFSVALPLEGPPASSQAPEERL